MSENEIRKAFDAMEPETGAQERMYANILKKAAAQQGSPMEAPAAEKAHAGRQRSVPAWRRWGSLAACLAVVIAAGFALPRVFDPSGPDDPPLMAGSPFEDVAGPEGFAELGFAIDAPEGAEDRYYCIYDGAIARVDFTLDGHEYTYEAARLDGNFSRAEGEAVGSVSLNAAYDATLDRLSLDTWRAHWSRDGVSCYLTNFDGAEEADITAAANALMESD